MGSRIAPPLAIVFMNAVESLILASDKILQPALYMRYIDDVIGIWTHGSQALDEFFHFINHFHKSLKFTIERTDTNPYNQIPFLDTLLTIRPSGIFTTELYIKPMAAPIILHYESAHPKQTKHSVLFSQMLRAMRLGSNSECKNRGIDKIASLFTSNGYPYSLIQRTRHRIMAQRERAPQHSRRTSPHNPTREQHTYISLPYIDETLARRVKGAVKSTGLPLRIAWKSGKTLANLLTRSALEPPPCPAGNRTCHTCEAGLVGKCHTKNVVYKITCNLCSDISTTYVGETRRSVRERYMEHLRDFKNKTPKLPSATTGSNLTRMIM